MGSISDMHNTNRAGAVLARDPNRPDIARLVGKVVTIIDAGVGPGGSSVAVSGYIKLSIEGEPEVITIDLGDDLQLADEGVCSYNLQDFYEEDELRAMIEATIADEDNGLDEDDRNQLREELKELESYYR